MSREILRKAQRKDNNEWIEGYYYKSWGCKNGIKQDTHMIHNYELDDAYEVHPGTLCWVTDKTDINGNRIWENDIVKSISNGFILQSVWSEDEQKFLFKNLEGGYDFMIGKISELSSFAKDEEVMIIGNATDNGCYVMAGLS